MESKVDVILEKISLKKLEIIEVNDLKTIEEEKNPLTIDMFPFFSTRLNNRNVNFEYHLIDEGIRFTAMLPGGKVFENNKYYDVYQPASFEKRLFEYLIFKYNQIESNLKEKGLEFEIEDFITNYCRKKMYRSYKERVQQALINMKNTTYRYYIDNRNIDNKVVFNSQKFSILDYEKIEVDGKNFYKVFLFDGLKKKTVKDNSEIFELEQLDKIAFRIYQYIGINRYSRFTGECDLEVLCTFIPLKTFTTSIRKNNFGKEKKRKISILSQNLKRVLEAFSVLKESKYIDQYSVKEISEKKWRIEYTFSKEKKI